jgi:transcriptional regulator with XRE-family HTH domain
MTDNERIRAIRSALDMTMEAFGKRIGVSRAAISNIENGNRGITNQLATSICREYNVNPDYLSGSSDEMFLAMSKEEEIAAFLGDILRDKDETFKKRFVAALARLTDEDWAVMEKIIDRIANKKD